MSSIYIDPLVGFAFKKLFGSEPNKDLLIAFLNEVFRGRKHIADLMYAKNEYYIVVLMDGFALPGSTEGRYLHDICLCDRNNGEVFYDELGFIYIELLNFVKTELELKTDLDGWLYVLKNMSRMKKIPSYLRKPIFLKFFELSEYCKLSREEKEMYDTEPI